MSKKIGKPVPKIAPKSGTSPMRVVLVVALVAGIAALVAFYVWPRVFPPQAAVVAHVDAGVVEPAPTLSPDDQARLQAQLQEAAHGVRCPTGTRRVGAEPPDGHEVWCERTGKDGKPIKDGPYESWYANGVKSIAGAYVDNERDGPWVMWHESGQRKQEASYVKGKLDGRFREWDAKGEPLGDAVYKNGKVIR